jgi:replicative DNA helicase
VGEGHVQQDLKDAGAERAILRSWMIDPGAFTSTCDLISPGDFTHVGAQSVARAIINLAVIGQDPDDVLVHQSATQLLAAQGISDAAAIARSTLDAVAGARGNPANALEYARAVRRMADLRNLREQARRIGSLVTPQADPNDIASQAMDALLSTAAAGGGIKPTLSYGDLIAQHHVALYEELQMKRSGRSVGMMTGFSPWDSQTHGMRESEMYVLAGDPGSGKTVLAMHMLRSYALLQREQVPKDDWRAGMMVSLEMGDGSTAMRWEQMATGLTTPMIRGSQLDESVLQRVEGVARDEGSIPLFANFSHGLYADQVKAVIANAVRLHNVRFVVIDHLRYIRLRNEPRDLNERDEQRIKYVHDEICKALNVTVILITHSTKASEGRDDKKPRMSDVRGSGQVSAQADGIAFMWRPWLTCTQQERMDKVYSATEAYLVWVKNRVDSVSDIPFSFTGETMKFIDAAAVGRIRQASQQQTMGDVW